MSVAGPQHRVVWRGIGVEGVSCWGRSRSVEWEMRAEEAAFIVGNLAADAGWAGWRMKRPRLCTRPLASILPEICSDVDLWPAGGEPGPLS